LDRENCTKKTFGQEKNKDFFNGRIFHPASFAWSTVHVTVNNSMFAVLTRQCCCIQYYWCDSSMDANLTLL